MIMFQRMQGFGHFMDSFQRQPNLVIKNYLGAYSLGYFRYLDQRTWNKALLMVYYLMSWYDWQI